MHPTGPRITTTDLAVVDVRVTIVLGARKIAIALIVAAIIRERITVPRRDTVRPLRLAVFGQCHCGLIGIVWLPSCGGHFPGIVANGPETSRSITPLFAVSQSPALLLRELRRVNRPWESISMPYPLAV